MSVLVVSRSHVDGGLTLDGCAVGNAERRRAKLMQPTDTTSRPSTSVSTSTSTSSSAATTPTARPKEPRGDDVRGRLERRSMRGDC